jgi:hypothetical protein
MCFVKQNCLSYNNFFLSYFKQRPVDCKLQNWYQQINDSFRCDTYKQLKNNVKCLKIFMYLFPFYIRKAFAQLCCLSYRFLIETGRLIGLQREDRYCQYCYANFDTRCLEDEFYVLFKC